MIKPCYIFTVSAVLLASCGNTADAPSVTETAVSELFSDSAEITSVTSAPSASVLAAGAELSDRDSNIVDLSVMDNNMAYVTLYNMYCEPEFYSGKTVKITGTFAYSDNVKTKETVNAVMVTDTAGCCSEGIRFAAGDSYVFPDDFPGYGEEITVSGTFSYSRSGDQVDCILSDTEIVKGS